MSPYKSFTPGTATTDMCTTIGIKDGMYRLVLSVAVAEQRALPTCINSGDSRGQPWTLIFQPLVDLELQKTSRNTNSDLSFALYNDPIN